MLMLLVLVLMLMLLLLIGPWLERVGVARVACRADPPRLSRVKTTSSSIPLDYHE